jgi:hypothetical protein
MGFREAPEDDIFELIIAIVKSSATAIANIA